MPHQETGPPQERRLPQTPADDELAAQIIRSSSEAILAADFDGNILYWNQAAERIYGWSAAEMTGSNLFNLVPPHLNSERTRAVLEEMRTRESWTRDIQIVRKDGSSFAGEVSIAQLCDDTGEPIGVVAVTSDISQRRMAEQRLAIQYNVTRLLAEATNLAEVASDVLQALCQELQWDFGTFWMVDESGKHLRCLSTWDDGSAELMACSDAAQALHIDAGAGLPGRVWSSGEALWLEAVASDNEFLRRTEALAAGIHAAIGVPVRAGTQAVHGVIEIMSRNPLPQDAHVLDMVRATAQQLGLFLERQRARESLRESELRLRRLEESNLIGIVRANLDGTIASANDAFLNMVGYTADDLAAGLRWDAMTPDEWRAVDEEIIHDVLTTGISPQKEKEYIRKDGSRVSVLLGSAQLQPETGDVVTFVVDMTANKQAEHEREASLSREQQARMAASDARLRADQLLRVTAAFSRARTPEEIAEVTINDGISVIGASGCAFTLLNDAGDGLRLLAYSGYGPGTLDRWKDVALPLDQQFPITECVVRGESIWVRSRQELFELFPVAREVDFSYSASIAAIPLVINGRTAGAINLGFEEERDFTEAERIFIETLVQFCSQALERARLFAAEQHAREAANIAQRRAEQLLNVTASLSRALTPAEVARLTIDQGLSVLDVQGGVIGLLSDDGDELHIIHSQGYPEQSEARWREGPIPIDRQVPLADAVRRSEPVWIYSQADLFEHYPPMAEFPGITAEAHVAIPMISGNRTYGVLGLIYTSSNRLSQAERTYASTLARLSSQALERANLFAAEQAARLAAEQAQQRLSLLAQAGELLTSSLDTHTTLDLVARLMVPQMADWCAIDVLGASGRPNRVTVIHVDPEKIRWAEDLQRRYPYDPNAAAGLANVLRTGKSELFTHVTDEMINAAALNAEHLEIIHTVGFSSVMIVPMIARGRTVGAITLVYAESGRHYSEADLALIEDLAYRSALAIDNARLYENSQQHAERMDAIAEVSRAFAEAGHDTQIIVETLAQRVADTIGDWAVVRLPSEDGAWLNPAAIHHDDAQARAALQQMFMQDPLRWNEGLTGRVASTGEAVMIPQIDPDALRQRIKPEYRHWMDRYAMYAVLIAPMRRRKQVVGTIALFRGTPDNPYTDEDRRFVQNVADRGALALENANLFHQTQEAVRLREEFLSIASHEMRTPLTTITGFAHLLDRQVARGQVDESKVATIAGSLLSEAIRLNQLVGDLLDVSRIQQGRLDIRPEACNLADIARMVVERLRANYEHSAQRQIVVNAPPVVQGIWDPTRIDQVLTNLLTNALKYSIDGEITVTIEADHADSVLLAVSDLGLGIPLDQQDGLFEPFVRGSDAHHRASGTGLGLYITRQIVEHHGGSIDLHSEPGRGTTFTVRLPADSESQLTRPQ